MNPQSDQTPGLRLPQPSFDLGQAPATHAPEAFHAPQTMPAPVPAVPTQPIAQPPVAAVPTSIPQPTPQQQAILNPAQGQPQEGAAAMQADDEGAVDQEWITKAREIVERTHSDPYQLSDEISKIKAQYIKVRYNKDIKITED